MLNLLPEITLGFSIAALLFMTLVSDRIKPEKISAASQALALLALLSCLAALHAPNALRIHATYRIDGLSQSFKLFIALALFLVTVFPGRTPVIPKRKIVEYHLFLFSSSLGMFMLSSAVEALTFVIALELSSYSLYLLVPLKEERWNSEAGMKYILFGAAASGLLFFGLSILLGLTGTSSFYLMAPAASVISSEPAFLLAFFFVSGALFFKLSLFPFHFWAPDAYEAAAIPVTTFIASASKAAAVAILLRLFSILGVPHDLLPVLGIFAFVSMALGNTAALLQKDVKRLLAYSSIAQAGYILIGLLSATPDAYRAVLFYGAAYLIMNLGAFLVVQKVADDAGTDNPKFAHFSGLADRSPLLALLLLVSLLSLAGIPPLVGFTGKWFLFAAAMREGHWVLVLAAVINSVISLFYYLTVIKHAYLYKAEKTGAITLKLPITVISLGLFLALVVLGVFPQILLGLAQAAFPQ